MAYRQKGWTTPQGHHSLGGEDPTTPSMTRVTVPEEALRARLRELDREREALTALLDIYGGNDSPDTTGTPVRSHNGARANGIAGANTSFSRRKPPTPATANGSTEAILAVVRERPGITISDLISQALDRIDAQAADPRKNMGTIVRYQLKAGRLQKRGEGYYPVAP